MNLVVLSPRHGQSGTTTVAVLLAGFFAAYAKRSTALLQFSSDSEDIRTYFGIENNERDIMRTPTVLYRLLESGAITSEEVKQYATPTVDNMDFFDFNADEVDRKMIAKIQGKIISEMPYNYLIMDVSGKPMDERNKQAIEAADYVAVVVSQNRYMLNMLKSFLQENSLISSRLMIIINHYEGSIMPLKNMIAEYNLPRRSTFTLHHNPQIARYMCRGTLATLNDFIACRHTYVADIHEDLLRVVKYIQLQTGDLVGWED